MKNTKEEFLKVMGALWDGGEVEYKGATKGWQKVNFALQIDVLFREELRIAPRKPSIDWSHVAPEFKWLTQDACGKAKMHRLKPYLDCGYTYWIPNKTSRQGFGESVAIETHASFKAGTCDWKDSLVERPKEEVKDTQGYDLIEGRY